MPNPNHRFFGIKERKKIAEIWEFLNIKMPNLNVVYYRQKLGERMRKIAFICIVAGGLVSGWNAALGASNYSVGVPLNPSKCVITPDSDMYSIDWKGPCTSSVNGVSV